MIILGIDPGQATTGYSLLEVNGHGLSLLEFGWINTSKDLEASIRLLNIAGELETLIDKFSPDILSMERLFFFANAKTAMCVAEAMGVIKMTAAKKSLPIANYAPLQIKMTVAGSGKAKKPEIQKAVRKIVKVRCPKKKKTHFNDAVDAIAVAICHAIKTRENESIKKRTEGR